MGYFVKWQYCDSIANTFFQVLHFTLMNSFYKIPSYDSTRRKVSWANLLSVNCLLMHILPHVPEFISTLAEKIYFFCCICQRSFPALINFYCLIQTTLCSAKQQANRTEIMFLLKWTANSSKGKIITPCNFLPLCPLHSLALELFFFKSLTTSAGGFLCSVITHI